MYAVVDREHGYCLDDNARGLLLATTLQQRGLWREFAPLVAARTAAFIQHAWNPECGRFRNFMSYDRRWLETAGSEESHGRAVWALGVTASSSPDTCIRDWARHLLNQTTSALPSFTSPRALACGLLGVVAMADVVAPLLNLRDRLAGRLLDHLGDARQADWAWFETSLSYDNARLSEAVLAAGHRAGRSDWRDAGLETLSWLWINQVSEAGVFSPVGNNGFWARGGARAHFDQQPIEAGGMVRAAMLAWRVTGDRVWARRAAQAFAWFDGANDLGLPIARREVGSSFDGLHPDRVNQNQGAESTLAWLQAALDLSASDSLITERIGHVAELPSP